MVSLLTPYLKHLWNGSALFCPQADVIIWDYEKQEIYARLVLHKAKVEDLSFSPNEKYLVSLGGQDDAR